MIIIPAGGVPCPVCKAASGERCRYVSHERYRGELIRHGSHNRRVWDAESATRMANVLLDN